MSTKTIRMTRDEVPVEETWNLEDLFPNELVWEAELVSVQEDVHTVTQYQSRLGEDAETLLGALKTLEAFQKRLIRVATYAMLRTSSDGTNPEYQAGSAKVASAFADIGAELSFVESELLTIPEETIENFIKEEPNLQTYEKMLADIMEKKPFTLAPEIEKILAALSEVHDAPYMIYERSKTSDMQFDPIVDHSGRELPMSETLYEDRYEMAADTVTRRNAYDSFIKTLDQYKHTYAATYATEVTKQVTLAKLRSYESVTKMLLHSQQVTEEMYENQLNVIQEELAPHMRRLAKLKQKEYGLDKITFCDLKAPLDPQYNPTTTYDDAKEMILDALQVLGAEYSAIMEKAFSERWIDRADNVGKQSGAFCSSPYGIHPYILITWTDMMRGTFTLAHELGHAGHFYLAGKNQELVNTDPSTYFVEAPSTMNELLLAEHLLEKTDDNRMKRWIISSLLDTYYHNFITHLLEGEFQRRVYTLAEAGTPLTADVLCREKKETIEHFWGDAVEIDDGAGLTWMRQPHYYMGLYPYTYSAGLTVSTAAAQQIKAEGKPAVDRWLDVLKAGGTLKPLELAKKAGVDMSEPNAIKEAVAYVGSLVDQLEKSYD